MDAKDELEEYIATHRDEGCDGNCDECEHPHNETELGKLFIGAKESLNAVLKDMEENKEKIREIEKPQKNLYRDLSEIVSSISTINTRTRLAILIESGVTIDNIIISEQGDFDNYIRKNIDLNDYKVPTSFPFVMSSPTEEDFEIQLQMANKTHIDNIINLINNILLEKLFTHSIKE